MKFNEKIELIPRFYNIKRVWNIGVVGNDRLEPDNGKLNRL